MCWASQDFSLLSQLTAPNLRLDPGSVLTFLFSFTRDPGEWDLHKLNRGLKYILTSLLWKKKNAASNAGGCACHCKRVTARDRYGSPSSISEFVSEFRHKIWQWHNRFYPSIFHICRHLISAIWPWILFLQQVIYLLYLCAFIKNWVGFLKVVQIIK